MARNGGLLNGIYRASYFVLDSVRTGSDGKYYRLVDARGGTKVMYMELRFVQDSLYFNAYTSRLGINDLPTRHMTFKAKKTHLSLTQAAATTVVFPQNTPAWDFSGGFNEGDLYVNQGDTEAKSASFLAQLDPTNSDVFTLGAAARDPFKIEDHPYLAYLQVDIVKTAVIDGARLFVYLSKDALTDQAGFMLLEPFNTVLLFPDVESTESQFTFTYLHPGDYYVTVIADVNGDGLPGAGDITHVSQPITIAPEGQQQITINNITVQN